MRKGTVNFHRHLARWLDLPPDVTADVPRIQMVGSYQVMVENHRGVDFFSDSEILLKVDGGKIQIRGEKLTIRSIFPEEIRIEGHIVEMRFTE
ncbi:sporulation protein YqfC [Planifilum fimeticola]|jgi:sporulation protein YqfC|uniref:Sporulation protein YqfC n=1 Tax=Planifilum fimeticola TaxID=201975 RepID=A0A2T0LFW2_9BACL|nr:sporulation protein YqfC [Planifilum fimeticola]PRX41123.1 sporulation protein YqfC [Planifilum fimeticola]